MLRHPYMGWGLGKKKSRQLEIRGDNPTNRCKTVSKMVLQTMKLNEHHLRTR